MVRRLFFLQIYGKLNGMSLFRTNQGDTPKSARYSHRWCNVAMADHFLEETLDFMEAVIRVHRGSIASMPNKSSKFQT